MVCKSLASILLFVAFLVDVHAFCGDQYSWHHIGDQRLLIEQTTPTLSHRLCGGGSELTRKKDLRKQVSNKKSTERGENYDLGIKENAALEAFYRAQKIVPEEQFETMMEAMRRPLPITFRVCGPPDFAVRVEAALAKRLVRRDEASGAVIGGGLRPLTFLPGARAWQIADTDGKGMRGQVCVRARVCACVRVCVRVRCARA